MSSEDFKAFLRITRPDRHRSLSDKDYERRWYVIRNQALFEAGLGDMILPDGGMRKSRDDKEMEREWDALGKAKEIVHPHHWYNIIFPRR